MSGAQIDLVLEPERIGEVWRDRAYTAVMSHLNAVEAGNEALAASSLERFIEASDMLKRARKVTG